MPGPRPVNKDRVAAKIEREERRRQATKLAVAGHTYEEIAAQLGYSSRQAAFRDVKAGLAPAAAALREEAAHYIAVQAARLEEMHRRAEQIFEEFSGEYSDKQDQRLAALDRMAKASIEFRKLTGIDAPTRTESKTELSGSVGYEIAVTGEELDRL